MYFAGSILCTVFLYEACFEIRLTFAGSCRDCLTRIPYATFIATVLCFIGIGVFCGTVSRGAQLANLILLDVFRVQVEW